MEIEKVYGKPLEQGAQPLYCADCKAQKESIQAYILVTLGSRKFGVCHYHAIELRRYLDKVL